MRRTVVGQEKEREREGPNSRGELKKFFVRLFFFFVRRLLSFFLYGGYLVLHQSLVNARRIFFVLCTSSLLAVVLFLKRLVLFHFSRVRPCEENCRWTREREGPNSRGEF